jgi:hypothetical protein
MEKQPLGNSRSTLRRQRSHSGQYTNKKCGRVVVRDVWIKICTEQFMSLRGGDN